MTEQVEQLLGADLGRVIQDCDFQAVGHTKDEVMNQAREHLSNDHDQEMDDTIAQAIEALIGPIKK